MLPSLAVVGAFAAVVALLTITPGLDTALVLRSATVGGRRLAAGVIAGIQAGTLVWGALVSVGVGALLMASAAAYDVLRLAGAAYLVWMGGRMLLSAVRGRGYGEDSAALAVQRRDSFGSGFRQGLLTNLLNPKMGAFYVALLPQFIPADAPQLAWGLALAGVHVLMGSAWLLLLTVVAARFRGWLARRSVARSIDGVAGTAIVGFGVGLALEGTRTA